MGKRSHLVRVRVRIDAWVLCLTALALTTGSGCGGGEQRSAASPGGEALPGPATSVAPTVPAAVPDPAAAPAPAASSLPSSSPASAGSSEASAGAPSASAEASGAGGDRSLNDIRATIAGNRDRFRTCYDQALKKHPGIEGKFVLNFVIHPDGKLKSAKVDDAASQIHAPDMVECAISVLKTLKFAPSKKGKESTVNYPFDFHPKGPKP